MSVLTAVAEFTSKLDTISANINKNVFYDASKSAIKEGLRDFSITEQEQSMAYADFMAKFSNNIINNIFAAALEIDIKDSTKKKIDQDTKVGIAIETKTNREIEAEVLNSVLMRQDVKHREEKHDRLLELHNQQNIASVLQNVRSRQQVKHEELINEKLMEKSVYEIEQLKTQTKGLEQSIQDNRLIKAIEHLQELLGKAMVGDYQPPPEMITEFRILLATLIKDIPLQSEMIQQSDDNFEKGS
jgi:hypothetical protein